MLSSMGWAMGFLLLMRAPADSTGTKPKLASLFVRATDQRDPLPFSQVIISGLRRGGRTDETGCATIDDIPPGRWEVRWVYLGYEPQRDTLTFAAGVQETLLVTDPTPSRMMPQDYLDLPASEFRQPPRRVLREVIGLVWSFGDACYLASASPRLERGTRFVAYLMDTTRRAPELTLAHRPRARTHGREAARPGHQAPAGRGAR